MSSKPTKQDILSFIERTCIKEVEELINDGYNFQALTCLVLGMEWVGATIDGKPTGAKKQSRKRFELALRSLPPQYWKIHSEIDLYRQLRNKTVHNPWVTGRHLRITDDVKMHLQIEERVVYFSVFAFFQDFKVRFLSLSN